MMATLNYNRIAICVVSVIILWVLAAAFQSHSSLSLQDLKDIAGGISKSAGFSGSSKSKPEDGDFPNQSEFDESFPPSTLTGTWEDGYDAYDEYDILPPGTSDGHTLGTGEVDSEDTAPSGVSAGKWGQGSGDADDAKTSPLSHDTSDTSHHADAGSDKAAPSGSKSSSSSGGKFSWFSGSSSKTKTWNLQDFKEEWLDTELGGNFEDGKELAKACAKADFNGHLVLHMQHSRGGVTNVRAGILDLVWFAILTGSHIVLPGYIKRPDVSEAYSWDDESLGYYGIENMFDREWFLNVMNTYCPQMTIYHHVDNVPSTVNITHDDLFHDARTDLTLVNTEQSLVDYLKAWLLEQPEYQPRGTNLVIINKMMWYFNWLPRPRLRKEMGHVVKINPLIRDLAATVVYNMRTTQKLDTIQPECQLYEDAYYGVHLRTEADAQQMGWMNDYGDFEAQTDLYLERCKELGLSTIYIASGSKEDIIKFAVKASQPPHNIQVLSKDDLLVSPDEQTALSALTWDQQGALDWEILSRATYFSGPVFSSFAWSIAIRRHYYNEDNERVKLVNMWAAQEDDPSVVWEDGLSEIVLKGEQPNPMEQIAGAGMIP